MAKVTRYPRRLESNSMHHTENESRNPPAVVLNRRIGNRWALAVEFDGVPDRPRAWNDWWGSLWLWVGGQLVGNPPVTEMLVVGLDALCEAAADDRTQASAMTIHVTAKHALDAVMQARYGNDSPNGLGVADDDLFALEILPRRTGPFFEGWEAILLDQGASERFIYRTDGGQIREAVWPKGTFSTVTRRARNEFEEQARALI